MAVDFDILSNQIRVSGDGQCLAIAFHGCVNTELKSHTDFVPERNRKQAGSSIRCGVRVLFFL